MKIIKRKKQTNKEIEVKRYNPDYDKGLTKQEVLDRVSAGFINKAKVKTNRNYFQIIVKNVFTFFNILLISIGAILIYFGLWTSCIFLVVFILNLAIGLFQDIRSKVLVDRLSLMNEAKVKTVRDGKTLEIYASNLVIDDVIILANNEQIPCDSIIIYGDCTVDESLVTGESLPVKKDIGDNLLSGTYIYHGRCFARVTAVGKDNYIEKLNEKSKSFKAPKSQMFLQINALFKIIGIIVIIFGIINITEFTSIKISQDAGSLKDWDAIYKWLSSSIILPLAGALISMIPSGMYLLTSTSLAVGIINLTKNKVLVQDMYSIETLARIDTLCLDKTGTITDGTMSIYDYLIYDDKYRAPMFDTIMASYNWAVNDEGYTGLALKDKFGIKDVFVSQGVIQFNSVNKYSAATLENIGTIVVGAYGFVPLTNNDSFKDKVEELSKKGFRILVVGLSKGKIIKNKLPNKVEGIALIVIQDHIRENAPSIIKWFNDNQVEVKIISGDNVLTVAEIAKNVGVANADKYISLEGKSIEEVKTLCEEYTIFGRVSPEQKEALIEALKEKKHTVGMFGDGVNDVLSLKAANVSISIKSASRASRDTASLVILDNDFAHLPEIVAQGRRVINNLQRTCSLFLTKTVFSVTLNLFFIIYALVTQFATDNAILWPFTPNSFYAWEIITIGLAAFFLALEPNNERVKGNFLRNIFRDSLPNGLIISIVMIVFICYARATNLDVSDPNSIRTIGTYLISISSCLVLFQVCYKFNWYRAIVFIVSIVLVASIFLLSTFGNVTNNWLQLGSMDSQPPRYLSTSQMITVAILCSISLVLMAAVFFIPKIILKINNNKKKNIDKEEE